MIGIGCQCSGPLPLRAWLWAVLAPLLTAAALTSAAQGAPTPPKSPQELVENTAKKMLDTLKVEKDKIEQEPDRIYKLVDDIVLPHFDFERMAKRVLGRYWNAATPQQRTDFTQQFRNLLVRTYANSLTQYTDQAIRYLPMRQEAGDAQVTVRSEVDRPGGSPVAIDYRLLKLENTWKVFDVTIDGVSLVTNYRSSFANEIDQGGLDKLIAKLAERSKQAKP